MLDQSSRVLKFACLLLMALVLYRIVHVVPRLNLLGGVAIPELPTLASNTNTAPSEAATNSRNSSAQGTNRAGQIVGTNSHPLKSGDGAETNLIAAAQTPQVTNNSTATEKNATNSTNVGVDLQAVVTNAAVATNAVVAAVESPTNVPSAAAPVHSETNDTTNLLTATNAIPTQIVAGKSNSISNLNAGTNAGALAKSKAKMGNSMGPPGVMMAAMGFNPRGMVSPELPADIKARVNRIYESEILAQAMHPLPMGLIGIAGDVAFLRSASGQTGLVKEGDTLGDLKLLRIGTNRVLVELAGQKRELMIFEGYGGKSLLPEKGKQPE